MVTTLRIAYNLFELNLWTLWCVKHIHIHEIYDTSVNGVIDSDNVIDTYIDWYNCFFI